MEVNISLVKCQVERNNDSCFHVWGSSALGAQVLKLKKRLKYLILRPLAGIGIFHLLTYTLNKMVKSDNHCK